MSAESEQQRKVFKFFLEKYNSQELFTKDDMQTAGGWDPKKKTFDTYWPKQFRPLLVQVGNLYRVSQLFKRYCNWQKFRDNILTQNRALSSEYKPSGFRNVVVFEFFMPLRNEEYLRAALDSLFFKDFIISKLKTFDLEELSKNFPRQAKEDEAIYLERVCDWISKNFVGYSINHVSGRFRACKLKDKKDAYGSVETGDPYLVDETTAIVRFVIPCGQPVENLFLLDNGNEVESICPPEVRTEAKRIRWFFYRLFVESIVEVVNGEDEIWLQESGVCSHLHIWRREYGKDESHAG